MARRTPGRQGSPDGKKSQREAKREGFWAPGARLRAADGARVGTSAGRYCSDRAVERDVRNRCVLSVG